MSASTLQSETRSSESCVKLTRRGDATLARGARRYARAADAAARAQILDTKVQKLEQLVRLKDAKIAALLSKLQL